MTETNRDALAGQLIDLYEELAVTVRERDPASIRRGAARILAAAAQDIRAAVIVAAALISIDTPTDPWWADDPADGDTHRKRLAAALDIDDDYRPGAA